MRSWWDGRSVVEIRDGHRGKRMSGTGTHIAGPKKRPGPPPGSLAVSPGLKCWRRHIAIIGSSLEIESELL